jgi:hypothetical protein
VKLRDSAGNTSDDGFGMSVAISGGADANATLASLTLVVVGRCRLNSVVDPSMFHSLIESDCFQTLTNPSFKMCLANKFTPRHYIVGAPGNDAQAKNAGAAYVYTKGQRRQLLASDGTAHDAFGTSVVGLYKLEVS